MLFGVILHGAHGCAFVPPPQWVAGGGPSSGHRTWKQLPAAKTVPRADGCIRLQGCWSWAMGSH